MENWILTDDSSAQYLQKVDDFTFNCIDTVLMPWDAYMVCYTQIDIRDYSLDELENELCPYCHTLDEICRDYGVRDAIQIIVECIFENTLFIDMEWTKEFSAEEEAIAFIEAYVKEESENETH